MDTTKKITRAGIIASLYVVLVFPVISFASGMIQFRPSEALCVLPLFFVEAVPALAIGCMLANLITGCAILDIVGGAVITLVASALTYLVGKTIKGTVARLFIGGLFPVLLNALFLPLIWYFAYGELQVLYIFNVLSIFVSQAVSVWGLGAIIVYANSKWARFAL